MGRRKLTTADKIRRYMAAHPTARPKQIAEALGVRVGYVHVLRSVAKKKNAKSPEEKISPLDTMPKVGDTVGGLTLTRAEKDGQYQYRWVRQAPELPITMEEPKSDPVNHPAHYKAGGIETIDFIEAKGLNYRLGNVVKYITRADHKGNRKQDLEKALWYLKREIEQTPAA